MNEESGLIAPKPKRRFDVFLFFCRLLNVITSVSSLLCTVAHGMAIVVGPPIFQELTDTLDQSLRLYGVIFSVFVVLVETDWQRLMTHVKLFESWMIRGIFQVTAFNVSD